MPIHYDKNMNYISVSEAARRWGLSARTVRNYAASSKIPGAVLIGKTWSIPENAEKPVPGVRGRKPARNLLQVLQSERQSSISGGIYHYVQVQLTYNSNHMEGSRLSEEQTAMIFDTKSIVSGSAVLNTDDIVETSNHFQCINLIIDQASRRLSLDFIKQLHFLLKSGTSDSRKAWFACGEFKKLENTVADRDTTPPEQVETEMKKLLKWYQSLPHPDLSDLIEFHVRFERIHPFQDGNGRIGRLILFKECLKWGITPFIIDNNLRWFYYRGLKEWDVEHGFLIETCLSAQDVFKRIMEKYQIPFED